MPAVAWRLDPVSSRLPRDGKWTKLEINDVWKHARIGNQLTVFTRNRLPGHSLVDHEYGDVTAIGQRHILPTAATRTVAKPQTLLELRQADLFIRAGHIRLVPWSRGPAT
jgi:hypothetical protein